MRVKIIVDSTVDLAPEVKKQVTAVVPLSVRFGDEEYKDGETITAQKFYEMLVSNEQLPTTSQPTPVAFEEAYEKAKGSEKDRVLAENVIAYLSSESVDMLKDPTSFALRDGYYYLFNRDDGTFGQQAVLYVSGKNSYGNTVSSYWVWVYDNEEEKWEYWGSATTTSKESGDDIDDTLVKIILKSVMEEGLHLQKSQIKNINNMFENDTLFDVTLIDKEDIDTSRFPNG
jgi:hypothetical protein